MAYKLMITERAEELVDNLVYHLLFRLKSEQAAKHFLDELEGIYQRLEETPFQFPICKDSYLASKGYHEAVLPKMNYTIVFDVSDKVVAVLGVFHQLENYPEKV